MLRRRCGHGDRAWLALAAILVAGCTIRWLASMGDLWLDEIWSLSQVQRADGLLAVLTIPHDNSHPLNSLWLYALGGDAPQLSYRLLAIASGAATIALAAAIGRTRGRSEALLAAGAIAASFPMVVYSSEARGYMPAAAAMMASYLLARRALAAPSWSATLPLWLVSMVGLLAHYAFIQVLVAIALWSAWHAYAHQPDRAAAIRAWLRTNVGPLSAVGVTYVLVLSHMRIGGGPRLPLTMVLGDAAGWTFGLPAEGWGAAAACGAAVAVVASEAVAMRRRHDDGWLFLVLMTALPVLALLLHPPVVYPRYFLLTIASVLLALSATVARLLRSGPLGRALGIACIAVFMLGNTTRDYLLVRDGRGQYRALLAWMAPQLPTAIVTGNNDFALRQEIAFHARALGSDGAKLRYVPMRSLPRSGADWLIVRRDPFDPEPQAIVEDACRNRYVLDRHARSYGPSGAAWYVYSRRR